MSKTTEAPKKNNQTSRERHTFNVEVRADQERRMIVGHAAVFDEVTDIAGWFNEVIARGAFDEARFFPGGVVESDRGQRRLDVSSESVDRFSRFNRMGRCLRCWVQGLAYLHQHAGAKPPLVVEGQAYRNDRGAQRTEPGFGLQHDSADAGL